MSLIRKRVENHQVLIYFLAVMAAGVLGVFKPQAAKLQAGINPALALMLLVTFLQVPVTELRRTLRHKRFFVVLLLANFVMVPLLLAGFVPFLPTEPLLRFGVLLVLLAPCIDYVVTFSRIGQANAQLLLAATPLLLLLQMVLLPFYLRLFMGSGATLQFALGPFLEAFFGLIVLPLALAVLLQKWAARSPTGGRWLWRLGFLPVPATALVLFIVVVAVVPQIEQARTPALHVLPFYVAFAIVAPIAGWGIARWARLEVKAARAVAFGTATRNSLVLLPLVLAVPGAMPVLPAIIVMQTLVELLASLAYMYWMPRLGGHRR